MRRTQMGTRTMETTAPSMRRATNRIQNPPYWTPPGAAIVTPGTAGARVPPQRVQKLAAALTAWPHWLQKTVASVMGQEYIATEKGGKWQSNAPGEGRRDSLGGQAPPLPHPSPRLEMLVEVDSFDDLVQVLLRLVALPLHVLGRFAQGGEAVFLRIQFLNVALQQSLFFGAAFERLHVFASPGLLRIDTGGVRV